MCAQFEVNITADQFAKRFGVPVPEGLEFSRRVFPYTMAPVVFRKEEQKLIELMMFNLTPHWSKEKKNKFATYNARVETIDDKPSFKKAFGKYHCIVPMTGFYESVHEKQYAGHIIKFSSEEILMAAGIFDIWVDKKSGEVLESFSIITKEPPPFIEEAGHDRCPIFLKEDIASQWLRPELYKAKQWKELLLSIEIDVALTVAIDRPLKNFKAVQK